MLSHRNRQLRSTQIKAPTWELHALSHSSPKAMKKESSDEKALIAMHNEILKANETYTFKPRTGGRMYFPSPVAGREIPIKPTKKYQYEKELLKSGGYLENSSLVSSMDGDFRAFSSAAGGGGGLGESSLLTGTNTRPSTTTSHVRKEVSIHTLEDVLRRQGTPGPIVFKTKRTSVSPSSRDRPSSSSRVVEVPPLRATTRLGFGREGRDWEQVDWPTVIRKRVADKLSTIAMGELEKEPGELCLATCCLLSTHTDLENICHFN